MKMSDFPLPMSDVLFIGDLSFTCVEADLHNLLSAFGDIVTLKMMRTRKQTPLGYAFVTFGSVEQAAAALKTLNGTMFFGRHLRIGYAAAPSLRKRNKVIDSFAQLGPTGFTQSPDCGDNQSFLRYENSIFFRFSFPNTLDTSISQLPGTNETMIRALFDEHCGEGAVVDVSIRRVMEDECQINGYGFIHFRHIEHCVLALELLHDVTHRGVHYTLEMSKNLQNQLTNHMIAGPSAYPPPVRSRRCDPGPLTQLPPAAYAQQSDKGYHRSSMHHFPPRWDSFSGSVFSSEDALWNSVSMPASHGPTRGVPGRAQPVQYRAGRLPTAAALPPRGMASTVAAYARGPPSHARDRTGFHPSSFGGQAEYVSANEADLGLPVFSTAQSVLGSSQQQSWKPSFWTHSI